MGRASRQVTARSGGRQPSLKRAFCAGAAADTDMTVTGIKLGDEIISVLQVSPPNDTGTAHITADRTATTKVTAANTIQCTAATNSPANSQLDILYWSR